VQTGVLSQLRLQFSADTGEGKDFQCKGAESGHGDEQMKLSEKAEEILESLWIARFEKLKPEMTLAAVNTTEGSAEVKELGRASLAEMLEGRTIQMTAAGEKHGEELVRRHRLAERLMSDILDMPEKHGNEVACHLEHMLKRGLDERVCTLLGHPRFCPHGSPIPPGACCKEKRDAHMKLVSPLSDMEEGEKGIIAYLHTGQKGRLERLLALGVLPGQPIALVQRFPSYVFRVGETQLAVDGDLAASIYVRLGSEPPARRRWRRRGPFLR
jgi:DtxR family transcriptional regulator, Mn-dependent transcriptional regulator